MKKTFLIALNFITICSFSQIQAISETIDYQNSPNAVSSISVLANDLLNNATPTVNDVIVSGINIPSGFTLNLDGTINVVVGTLAGSNTFTYRICETANPDNCSVATSVFNLTSNIQAVSETIEYQNSPNAVSSISVLANDLLNNAIPSANDVIVSSLNIPSGFTLNPDGTINVAIGTQAGSYTFTYRICETTNPDNCAVATSVFNLTSNIVAVNDAFNFETPPENGSIVSVLDNDILNSLVPNSSTVNVSFINIPSGFTLNADGTITIPSSFTEGNFSIDYRICETAFPDNCTIANASIVIANPFAPSGNTVQIMPISETLAGLTVTGQNILWYSSNSNRSSNSALSGTPIPSSTVPVLGSTYYASQTVNGIESISRLPVTISSSLSTNNFSLEKFNFYPNPIVDNLSISNDKNIDQVEIYSIHGQKLISKEINEMQSTMNLVELQKGVYLMKIFCEGQNKTIKIIKN
jgi:hypothetical protein